MVTLKFASLERECYLSVFMKASRLVRARNIVRNPILNKTRWRCHRGMRELDLLLLTFFDRHFETLSVCDQEVFTRLLEENDTDLLAYLLGQKFPGDKELARIVKCITSNN